MNEYINKYLLYMLHAFDWSTSLIELAQNLHYPLFPSILTKYGVIVFKGFKDNY